MAKKKIDSTAVEIRGFLADSKLVIGAERTIKMLKLGKLKQVYLTPNCADAAKQDILRYTKLSGAKVTELAYPSLELGVICKKPYAISVLGVLK